jgi:hypothetical protein
VTIFKDKPPRRREPERFGDRRRERGRNPLEILIEREAGTCKGCIHILKSPLGGPEIACRKRKAPAVLSVERSRRCEIYDDGKGR